MKDILCLDYSWVPNSRFIFNRLADIYSVDIVDETNIQTFSYANDYKMIILYLHEGHLRRLTDELIARYPNAVLVQHDDTDLEHIQNWSNRVPDLVMQRELTDNSQNPRGSEVKPHHFPIPSMHIPNQEKDIDVFFMGTLTNPRRVPFIKKLQELKENSLSHLRWELLVTARDVRTPTEYKNTINRSKIGLHYYGNSYDSWRIWELASCDCAILMPESPLLSINEAMPFTEFETFKEDFSDLEDKIKFLLADNNWTRVGQESKLAYDLRHNPEKCFEYYHSCIKELL